MSMFEKEISRRDAIKVGVVVAAGSIAVLRGGTANAQATSLKSKVGTSRGQTIARNGPSGVLFDDGTTAELVGFGDGYAPEVGDQVAVVGGVAYPILRGLNASTVKVSGSNIDADGKMFRAVNRVSNDSSPGVLMLLDNEKTGESKCLGIQRG
jgi:hypothetical protein